MDRPIAALLDRIALALATTILCIACADAPAQSPPPVQGAAMAVDQIIVKFKSPQLQAAPAEALAAQASALSARAQMPLRALRGAAGGAHVFKLERSVPLDEAQRLCAELARDPTVAYAEPDAKMRIQRPAAPRSE